MDSRDCDWLCVECVAPPPDVRVHSAATTRDTLRTALASSTRISQRSHIPTNGPSTSVVLTTMLCKKASVLSRRLNSATLSSMDTAHTNKRDRLASKRSLPLM